MRYSVRWSRRALDAVAEIWVAYHDQRAEVTQAVASVDRLLAIDPSEQGESRNEDWRVLFVSPLVATFKVDEVHQVVQVLNIRHLKRRGTN